METHFPFAEESETYSSRQQLAADLKVVIHDAEQLLKSAAGELNEKAGAELQRVLAKAKSLAAQLEVRTAAGLRTADRAIREHPYPSIGIAFGVGLLIGVLVNRR